MSECSRKLFKLTHSRQITCNIITHLIRVHQHMIEGKYSTIYMSKYIFLYLSEHGMCMQAGSIINRCLGNTRSKTASGAGDGAGRSYICYMSKGESWKGGGVRMNKNHNKIGIIPSKMHTTTFAPTSIPNTLS